MPFGSRSSWSGLCCANCCADNTLVGAYWGFSICGGNVHITRLPEVYREGAIYNDTGDAYSWMRTDSIRAPNLTEGGITYKCVSGAGTQCSDAGVTRGVSYLWAQLNYAPLSDLSTTHPRAALARIAVHDSSTSAVSTDTENRSATLAECWLVNDENGDPFYWDAAWKLCNYMDLDDSPLATCVGPGHFVLEKRRESFQNQITYWTPDVADATIVTWNNPENTLNSTWYVAKYDPTAFPMALFMRTTVNTTDQISKAVDCGYANIGSGTKATDTENDVGSGNTYNWTGEWIRGDGGAVTLTAGLTAVYVQGFAFHGAYVPDTEADITPFYYGEFSDEPSRTIYLGTAILQTRANLIDVYTGVNRASTTVYTGDDFPPPFQFLWGSGITESPAYLIGGHAEMDGFMPSVDSESSTTRKLWGFPGNHRCGRQYAWWTYSEPGESLTDAGIGAYVTYETAGDVTVRYPAGTTTTTEVGMKGRIRVSAVPLSDATDVPSVIESIDSLLRPASLAGLRVLPAAYDHNGDVSADNSTPNAPRMPRFVLENFPLSLFANPDDEPDAVEMGQYTPAVDPAVPIDTWNRLAHPEIEDGSGTAGLGARYCYHWVYVDYKLYPMIRINSQGKWEPREPPTGQWYDSEGVLHKSRTLCWDGHIDAKHPSRETWGDYPPP